MSNRALFLDRDGVICHLVKYSRWFDSPQRIEDVRLVDGIENVIKAAKDKSFKVIEISNQPGVAKGKQTQKLSDAIEERVHKLLQAIDADVDEAYICNHHPQGVVTEFAIECDCRKPKPGLLIRAAKEHNIDLPSSIFYGDKASDVQASHAAGCKSIILLQDEDIPEKVLGAKKAHADFKVNTHQEAVKIISQYQNT